MIRFDIQDIVCQDYFGVMFHAIDRSTGKDVELRRIFPSGLDDDGGTGLSPREGDAFSNACRQLSKVDHPALRKTILGDIDPVDGMPYLVSEWIDGQSLSSILGNNLMEPEVVIELVRQALEVCAVLSNTLGSEAIWIDTSLDSIIITNLTENPAYKFRTCPLKWFESNAHLRDLTSIIAMVEELIGWKSKLVSDHAGLGLGGWLKCLRRNPGMALSDAIQSLPGGGVQPTSDFIAPPLMTQPPRPVVLASVNPPMFTAKTLTLVAIAASIAFGAIFLLSQKNNQRVEAIARAAAAREAAGSAPMADTPMDEMPAAAVRSEEPAAVVQRTDTHLWTPAEIPTAAWYDASDADAIVASGGKVSQWKDKSGNNRHVVQPLADRQPAYASSTVRFDGENDFLVHENAFMYASGGIDIYVAGALSGELHDKRLLAESSSTSTEPLYAPLQNIRLTNTVHPSIMSAYVRNDANETLLSNNYYLSARGAFDLSTRKIFQIEDDGRSIMACVNAGNPMRQEYTRTGTLTLDRFGIGAIPPIPDFPNGNSWLRADVNEIVIAPAPLENSERQKMEGYLAHKWDLAGNLPENHPYKLSAPTSSITSTPDDAD